MKGYIRIGGAVFCGVAIIATAFYARSYGVSEKNGAVVVLEAPQKEYIESIDANQNGTPDWEDELRKNIIASINASTTFEGTGTDPYTPPTTYTGKFSEAFFKDYLVKKGSGDSLEDPTELINTAVASIEKSTESKRYSRLEIIAVPNSPTDIREYGNNISKIVMEHPAEGRFEAVILQKALEANDPSMLSDLSFIREDYEAMLRDTLLVSVPESLVRQHLDLLNAYESILTDIKAMEGMFNDPLYGLARMKRYGADGQNLVTAFRNIILTLGSNGVTYSKEEPGAYLYLFDS